MFTDIQKELQVPEPLTLPLTVLREPTGHGLVDSVDIQQMMIADQTMMTDMTLAAYTLALMVLGVMASFLVESASKQMYR